MKFTPNAIAKIISIANNELCGRVVRVVGIAASIPEIMYIVELPEPTNDGWNCISLPEYYLEVV